MEPLSSLPWWTHQDPWPSLPPFELGAKLSVRQVDRSLAELDAIRDEIITMIPTLEESPAPVVSISVSSVWNAVILAVDGPMASVRETMDTRFGGAVEVVRDEGPEPVECVSRFSCDPWRGGIEIWPGDNTGLQCSYGFDVRSTISSQRYLRTAEHGDYETWEHAGYNIGTTNLRTPDRPGHDCA